MFSYDRTALDAEIDSAAEIRTRLWTRERITFDAAYGGEEMVLYLYLPNNSTPPYQTVVLWPTGGAYFPTSSIDTFGDVQEFLIADGRALAVPVYAGTFERKRDRNPFAGAAAYRDLMVDGVKDLRRSIDYLETRADIDTGSLAYFGHSQGGIQAPIALVQDARFRVAIVYVGFIPANEISAAVDPVHALPRVDVPVLMLSGEFDLIGTPEPDKKHVVAPGGHFVPNDVLIRESLDWLDAYLGPVRRQLMSSSGPDR